MSLLAGKVRECWCGANIIRQSFNIFPQIFGPATVSFRAFPCDNNTAQKRISIQHVPVRHSLAYHSRRDASFRIWDSDGDKCVEQCAAKYVEQGSGGRPLDCTSADHCSGACVRTGARR
jgi:hypothetical protein